MPFAHRPLIPGALAAAFVAGCVAEPTLRAAQPGAPMVLGDASFVRPIEGIDAARLEAYQRGRVLFEKNFTPSDGLGPLYNNTSCRACHGMPASGGGSAELLTLVAGEFNGAALTLKEDGGPVVSDKVIQGMPTETMPIEAVAISKRISPPTFGEGLIEAIPVKAITARLAASPTRQALGIRGRANWDFNQLGRFGWKAQTGDMVTFTVNASNFEMGLSSPQRPHEFFPNMLPQAVASPKAYAANKMVKQYFDARGAAARKPDLTAQQVDDMTAFQRYQAPPARLTATTQVRDGEATFKRLGCAECHVPSYQTGPNEIGVPVGREVALYSDLLLHDMGEAGSDGIRWQGSAGAQDWRTAPLWGLRFRQRFMHNGLAGSLDEAIMAHGGEGQLVTDAYAKLDAPAKDALRAFLSSL